MPILTFTKLEDMPEDLREHAKEKADKSGFEINVAPNAKLDEFRQNNIKVAKERDDFKAFVESVKPLIGEDVSAFKARLEALTGVEQRVKDGKLQGSEQVETEVVKRTETMRQTLEGQIAAKATEATTWKNKYDQLDGLYKTSKVDNAFNSLATDPAFGLNPQALPDVLARARSIFEVQTDGSLLPKKNGEIIRGEDGVTPMSPSEWIKGLQKEASYYFLKSTGGGAAGDTGGGGSKFGGLSMEEVNALSPMERLKLANRQGAK